MTRRTWPLLALAPIVAVAALNLVANLIVRARNWLDEPVSS